MCFPEIMRHSSELGKNGKLSKALVPTLTGTRVKANKVVRVWFSPLQGLLWLSYLPHHPSLPSFHVSFSKQVPSGTTWPGQCCFKELERGKGKTFLFHPPSALSPHPWHWIVELGDWAAESFPEK